MKFVIAPDSFKESMTAKAAAVAIQAGLQKIYPDADYELVPMADGGEGTVQSLVDATEGEIITADVQNPLDETVSAFYSPRGGPARARGDRRPRSGGRSRPPARYGPGLGASTVSRRRSRPHRCPARS